MTRPGRDESNELSYLFLEAQSHILLPQPNLSARLHEDTPDALLDECTRVIGLGSGMPQVFNDESIIPALEAQGISPADATTTRSSAASSSPPTATTSGGRDAAMFNLVKALELAMNDGRCLLTGAQLGPQTGYLTDFATYEDLERAFAAQIDYFFEKMIEACEKVEEIHQRLLPVARSSRRSSTTASSAGSTSPAAARTTTCPASRSSRWPTSRTASRR